MAATILTNPNAAPYPMGRTVPLELRGHVIASLTTENIDSVLVPFDCYVESAEYAITKMSSGDISVLKVTTTNNDVVKTVVDTPSTVNNDVLAAATAIHSDVAGKAYKICKGETLKLIVTSAASTQTNVKVRLNLIPAHAGGDDAGR